MTLSPARRPQLSGVLPWILRIAGAGLLGAMGWIHLDLWEEGYRTVPVIGPAFLVNAVAAIGLAVLLIAGPRSIIPWVAALGTLTAAGTVAALLLATTVGLFGFQESMQASHWWESVWVEIAAVVVLGALAVLGGRART